MSRMGRDADGTFRIKDFANIAVLVNITPTRGVLKDAKTCQDRSYHLRGWYGAIKDLEQQSGFGWDSEKSTVTAEDYTWNKYLEVSTAKLKRGWDCLEAENSRRSTADRISQ